MKLLGVLCASTLATVLGQVSQDPAAQADPLAESRDLAARRYGRVERELAARGLEDLSAEQRARRAEVLAALVAYRTCADFGIDLDHPGARVPLFVDKEGRRCAMAELLHSTGRDDLVSYVAAHDNLAWIVDLADNTELLAWLDQHGLSLEEAARIQGPAMPAAPPPPSYFGASDTVAPEQGSSGAAARSGAVSGGRGAVPFSASSTQSPPGPERPTIDALTEAFDAESWWMWWEYNKVEFLRPNRLLQEPVSDAGVTTTSRAAFVRSLMFPVVRRALEDGDPQVRSAAALTLGRIGGLDAVEPLLALLGDPNLQVRESSVLGLGTTGAHRAQEALLSIAREARLPGSIHSLGRSLQPLAVVALGIGRQLGFEAGVDDAVAEIVRERSLAEREELGIAAMMYCALVPTETLRQLALQLAWDGSEPVTVRCRAVESLRSATDDKTLSALQHLLSSARLEVRRSAALALGEYRHALVVPALQTAYDLEKDHLTRAFLLISLGRQGGAAARDHLLTELAEGPKALRPWTALSLGLAARGSWDSEVARRLRESVGSEKNSEARAAYWLASGLAGDEGALDAVAEALSTEASPRNRMYAAQALALIGGEAVRTTLIDRIPHESSELTRSALALSLGILGAPSDSSEIAQVFTSTSEPILQGQVASAMAFHGSSEAVSRLGSWCGTSALAGVTRAAALDGLGMLVGSSEPLRLGELSRSANFPLFAPWTVSMFGTTL